MSLSTLKTILKIGLITTLVIILFEIFNLLVIYKYFKFDYYLTAVAVIAMITGIVIAKREIVPDCIVTDQDNSFSLLTLKEREILAMIYEGKTNKEIAALNFVEISTIKTHINNLYHKLGVKNRISAIEVYHKALDTQKSTFSPPRFS